ncbi:hypothetical protein C1H76_7809 [Elsinoe australis]|uniref:Uncharacterized protein n=1 Tax=Elsinoe australis TaxID=40998 RepID=A0A4U7AS96_9PEZI|nr:hypothetical protein C1H76_7809 [Elsinoe australis]
MARANQQVLDSTSREVTKFCHPQDTQNLQLAIIHSKPSDEHQKQLHDLFGLPLSFWSKYEQEASGYFAAYDYPDSANALGAHTTTLRLLIKVAKTPEHPHSKDYAWLEFGIFTHWVPGGKVHVLVQCGDQPTTIDVLKQLRTEPVRRRCTRDPYAVQAYILEHLVKEFDASVWSWRDRVRQFEKDRLKPKTKAKAVDTTSEPDPDYQRMHEAFAAVTQHDSKVAVRIAEATQSDSASTKTISFLGLIFLPSTFVCSLFSTSFFSLQPTVDLDGSQGTPSTTHPDNIPTYWIVSDRFWIYWAFAIPLTLFTILVWSIWQNYTALRHPKASDMVPKGMKFGAMFSPRSKDRKKYHNGLNEIELGQKDCGPV